MNANESNRTTGRIGTGGRPMPPCRRNRAEDGFTLLEVMVAVMLLTVGVLGVLQVFAVSDRHTAYSREETIAVSLVQEIREKILSESFADVVSIFDGIDTNLPGGIPLPAQDWADHVSERLGPNGRGRVEIDTPADDPSLIHGMLGVTIRVSWHERGREVEVPVRFAIAKISP